MKKRRLKCKDCGRTFWAKYAQYCPECRWRHRGKRKKYELTETRERYLREYYDGKVYGRAAEIAQRFGWPDWAVKNYASRLGLAYEQTKKEWSKKEEDVVRKNIGKRTPVWIARQLGRTELSVVLKMKRMKISRKLKDGYTKSQLCAAFGCDHRVIEQWVRDGKLKINKYGTHREGSQGDIWCVSEQAVFDFIREHPLEFRLDKVHQEWFMGLVLGKRNAQLVELGRCSVCRKAIRGRMVRELRPTGPKGKLESYYCCPDCAVVLNGKIGTVKDEERRGKSGALNLREVGI